MRLKGGRQSGRIRILVSVGLIVIFLLGDLAYAPNFSAQSNPLYARTGAYALYDIQGGAVAFFTGVYGNISYTVTNIFVNGSMSVRQVVNVTEGDEIAPSYQVFNYTDSVLYPKVFPVAPNISLGQSAIIFENITLTYSKTAQETVGAGTFDTVEYQGTSNGTSVSFYFDKSTGLAVYELSGTGSVISLSASNIATPISVQDPTSTDVPYILLFVIVFSACGVGYYEVTRYYAKQARRDFKKKLKKERKRVGENGKGQ